MSQKFLSRLQKGIPFIAFTSEVHPRLSLSINFFKIAPNESFNNEKYLRDKSLDPSLIAHYNNLNSDHDQIELDKLLVLFKSHYSLFKSFPYEQKILMNTAFINNFDYFASKNLNITFKIINHIFSLRSYLVRREWVIQNEEAVMEKIYNFIKNLLEDNHVIVGDRIISIIWIFRDWDLINRVFTSFANNYYCPDYPTVREILNLQIFYIKYKNFAVNKYLSSISSKYIWASLTPLMLNSPQIRNCDFLFPQRANLRAYGSEFMKEVESGLEMAKRYGTKFSIKESATYFRFLSEYQTNDIPLLQSFLDHIFRSIMTNEATEMRYHLIDIICNLPRLQMMGLKVPHYYYIFLYKAIIGSEFLLFLDLPKTCLEFLEMVDLPDHIKKIVLKVFFLNQRLQYHVLAHFDNLQRIYSDESITIDYSPIAYSHSISSKFIGLTEFNTFNFDLRCLAPNTEENFPGFNMMEGKSADEVIEKISMTIDILSTKISIRNRLTCVGYLIYLSRYNPGMVRDYFESRNCNVCPFNSMIYRRQLMQYFYMLYDLNGDQVINMWLFMSKSSEKLYGLIDAIDLLFSLKIIKITNHQNYNYLREIFAFLNEELPKVCQQYFETIFIFTCWTGYFESGLRHHEVSAFYSNYLGKLSSSLASQPHYIHNIRYLLNWLEGQEALSPENKQKFLEILVPSEEEIELYKSQNSAATRLFYREKVNLSVSLGKFFAFNFMSPEGLNLTIEDADDSLKRRIRMHSKRMNLDHVDEE
jgi:hypothetical protein